MNLCRVDVNEIESYISLQKKHQFFITYGDVRIDVLSKKGSLL